MEAAAALPRRLLLFQQEAPHDLPPGTVALYVCLCALFVLGSGAASGLTLGLLSLSPLELEVLRRSGTDREKALAKSILPIISDPHWLLVTLLLCNAGCFEALPIFLDALMSPLEAILISITLILLFGEILPQAVCARYGLVIGAAFRWPVRVMMWIMSPIAWPLARLLDMVLGREGYSIFKRRQLKALVDLHGADEGLGGRLSDDEVRIICGALDLTSKIAYMGMTPLDRVVMLSTDDVIDQPTLSTILASGHSRLPVYAGRDKTNIVGLLLVKELLHYAFVPAGLPHDGPSAASLRVRHAAEHPLAASHLVQPAALARSGSDGAHVLMHNEMSSTAGVRVFALPLRPLPRVPADTPMYDLLKLFQVGRTHMVVLTQPHNPIDTSTHPSRHHPALPASSLPNGLTPPVPTGAAAAGSGLYPEPSKPLPARLASLGGRSAGGAKAPTSPFAHLGPHSEGLSTRSSQKFTPLSNAVERECLHVPDHPLAAAPDARDPPNSTAAGAGGRDGPIPALHVSPHHHEQHGLLAYDHEPARKPSSLLRIAQSLRAMGGGGGAERTGSRNTSSKPDATLSRATSVGSAYTDTVAMSDVAGSELAVPEVPAFAPPGAPVGVLTMEDVLETLVDRATWDETDVADEAQRLGFVNQLPERLRAIALQATRPVMLPCPVPPHPLSLHTLSNPLAMGAQQAPVEVPAGAVVAPGGQVAISVRSNSQPVGPL